MSSLPFGMLSLPDELVVEVLLYLDCRSVLRSSQTCRKLHAIVIASKGLQYVVELGLTGTSDGSAACTLNTSERLQLLCARKQRRRGFLPELAFSLTIDCPDDDFVYDFVDEVFVVHYVRDDAGVEVSHLLAYDLSPTGSGRLLFHTQLDFILLDFSIDPSRNFIAFAEIVSELHENPEGPEVRVHLRSLSSGGKEPHSEARMDKLTVIDETLSDPEDIYLTLAGDMVAYFSQCSLYVWRWTTGARLICWELSTHDNWYNTFTFVSPTSFVITESGTECGSIHLYALPLDDTIPTSTSPEDRKHVRFYLPELSPTTGTHSAILSAHTGAFSTPTAALTPGGSVLLLFVTAVAPDSQIVAQLTYIIRMDVFEDRRPHAQPIGFARSEQIIQGFRWTEWGPENSRLLPYIVDSRFAARGSHGSRLLMAVHPDDNTDREMVYTYFDFADARDRAFLNARQAGNVPLGPLARSAKMRTQFNGELYGARGIFNQPVHTTLPYCSTEMTWEQGLDDEILLGDDCFVKKTYLIYAQKLQLDVYNL